MYRKTAEQGVAEAQYRLGICYGNGEDVPQNYAQAAAWYRKAAEQGHADAQYILAICYDNGRGVQQDYAQAVEWFRKAAEQGHTAAREALGRCYENGIGVAQDDAQAAEWYRKAGHTAASTLREPEQKARQATPPAQPVPEAPPVQEARKEPEGPPGEAFYRKGLSFHEQGDYMTALLYFEKAGSEGHEQAQKMYFDCKKKLT